MIIQMKFLLFLTLLITSSAHPLENPGNRFPKSVQLDNYNATLHLKGTGTRTKFMFDIYTGALYLEEPGKDEHSILCSNSAKRIALYFVYDEVSREKLQEGWLEGFNQNNSPELLSSLKDRLDYSLEFFTSMKKDDVIYFDYLPDSGTRITVNGQSKGVIEGFDFMQAILKVWIGASPAQESMKASIMGYED